MNSTATTKGITAMDKALTTKCFQFSLCNRFDHSGNHETPESARRCRDNANHLRAVRDAFASDPSDGDERDARLHPPCPECGREGDLHSTGCTVAIRRATPRGMYR